MEAREPLNDFVTVIEDSRRWAHVPYRADDIVISTPPKSGTTWMQGIVSSLLWPAGDAPGTRGQRSPWPDIRLGPIDELAEALEAQTHRRFIKTHTPADCFRLDPRVSYITVYRSATDALVSWGNHRATMHAELIAELNNVAAAADGLAPLQLRFEGDYDALLDEWETDCSPARHLASWWDLRHEPNVLMLHYADLWRDLPAEMQRVAAFLDIDVPSELWEATVDRCRLDAMREEARAVGGMERAFAGGADAFYNVGGNGRGGAVLSGEQIARVDQHCADHLPADAIAWLEAGGAL